MTELLDLLKQAQAQALDPQDYEPGAAVKTLDEAMKLSQPKPMGELFVEYNFATCSWMVCERIDSLCVKVVEGPFATKNEAERYAKDQAPA